jgi:membrane protein implicated in regulation of membrane protease activity
VLVRGELWRAHAGDGSQLRVGEEIEVRALDGLELTVMPLGSPDPAF